jgi:hypothetical protein
MGLKDKEEPQGMSSTRKKWNIALKAPQYEEISIDEGGQDQQQVTNDLALMVCNFKNMYTKTKEDYVQQFQVQLKRLQV